VGTYDEAHLMIMERHGYAEETYYTFSYSPMPDDADGVGGLFCACTDGTQQIISERQLTLLRELAARTAKARTVADVGTLSANSLETDPRDFPFALLYFLDPNQRRVVLAGAAGMERGHRAAPEVVVVQDASAWPFAEVLRTNAPYLISQLRPALGTLPTGAWERPPTQAAALPIAPPGRTGRAGVLIVGLNPHRLFDANYRGFLGLVAGQIAAALANANAHEEEHMRAEALAEIDRAKTLFFSNVSHEFRTPLTLMLAPLEELLRRRDELPRALTEEIDVAVRNTRRLLTLVNTLLDFSRIEAGRLRAQFEPTDLAALRDRLKSWQRAGG
jgi:signal transduction histidine kinase